MASNSMFGWDLTFKTVETDIKNKADVVIVFIHWSLSKRGFLSIGVGEETTLTGKEEKSELLPNEWNKEDNRYSLRYVLDGRLYILHGLNSDGNLIVNLMRAEDLAVTNVAVKVDEKVTETKGPIETMIPDYKEFVYTINRDVINPITEKTTASTKTQTTEDESRQACPEPRPYPDSRRLPPRPDSPTRPEIWNLPEPNPLNVGRHDLDPFAPGGGGMLFNPFVNPRRDFDNPGLGIPGGLPRNAVPPGARFDPFGPPGGPPMPNRRAPPDADHFQPPGFGNDMFM